MCVAKAKHLRFSPQARALGGFLLAKVWTPDLLDQQPSALGEASVWAGWEPEADGAPLNVWGSVVRNTRTRVSFPPMPETIR